MQYGAAQPFAAATQDPVGEVQNVPLAKIEVDDVTFRFRISMRVGDLVQSIREHGQQIPVILRPLAPDVGRYQVISGFRRIRALRELGLLYVNAIVRPDLVGDDAAACRLSILENEARKSYSDIDRAYAIIAYRKMGQTNAGLAEVFKLGRRQLQRLRKLTEFPPEVQDAIAAGRVPTTHAIRVMQHVNAHGGSAAEWMDWIESEGASARQLGQRLRQSADAAAPSHLVLFTREDKGGRSGLRVRPLRVDEAMRTADREQLLASLRELILFVEDLELPPAND